MCKMCNGYAPEKIERVNFVIVVIGHSNYVEVNLGNLHLSIIYNHWFYDIRPLLQVL